MSQLELHVRSLDAILRRLHCSAVEELPRAAERYFLGDDEPEHSGAEEVDRRLDRALIQESIELVRLREGDQKHLGRLLVTHGGFRALVREDVSQSAFRFVLAHEIAHTLAYDATRELPIRLRLNDAAEEKLCNIVARQLLLPDLLLGQELDLVISGNDVSVEAIDQLAEEYEVAPWQVLLRVLEASSRDDILAILWTAATPRLFEDVDHETRRVLDSWSPLGMYIPNRDRTFEGQADTQLVWKLIRSGQQMISGRDVLTLGTLNGGLESVCFAPRRRPEHIVQVVFLDREHRERAARWRVRRGLERT